MKVASQLMHALIVERMTIANVLSPPLHTLALLDQLQLHRAAVIGTSSRSAKFYDVDADTLCLFRYLKRLAWRTWSSNLTGSLFSVLFLFTAFILGLGWLWSFLIKHHPQSLAKIIPQANFQAIYPQRIKSIPFCLVHP